MAATLETAKVIRLAGAALVAMLAAVVLAAALSRLYVHGVDGPITNPTDFRAFYCGGDALARGRDPYRVEPLLTCERRSLLAGGLRMDERHVLPAPFPPYVLFAFSAFAREPFRIATEGWLALNVMALGIAIAGVARLSRLRPGAVALALIASAGYASLVIGQLVPIVLAALVLTAISARRGDGVGAAAGATVAALEPHVAFPAWCALLLFVPRSRVPLGVAAAILCAASLAVGPALTVEYLSQVVPEHARSEIYNFGAQYSLSSLLAVAGVSVNAALRFGSLSYGCALIAGLWLGKIVSRRFGDPAFAVTAPVAVILIGGPFVHGHQIALALPFGLMLFARVPMRRPLYAATFVAVCALAVPWESLAEMPAIADRLPQKASLRQDAVALQPPAANDPVELPYTAFMDAFAERNDPRTAFEQLLTKLPTWYGLLALVAVARTLTLRRSSNGPEASLHRRRAPAGSA